MSGLIKKDDLLHYERCNRNATILKEKDKEKTDN